MRISKPFLTSVFPALLAVSAPSFGSSAALVFPGSPVDLGTMQQGDSKAVELKVRNSSAIPVALEMAMSQNVGSSNFNYPSSIGAGAEAIIRFNFDASYMDGPFEHNIVLVETDGTPHVGQIKGIVATPLETNERLFDIGYVQDGSKVSVRFYVWAKDGSKDFPLQLDSGTGKGCEVKLDKVTLDVSDFEHIKEGGKTFGYKVTLHAKLDKFPSSDPRSREKSIRRIVGLKSSKWPKATPELLLVGYWK